MKNFCEAVKIFIIGLIFSSVMIFSANCSAVDYYVGDYKGAEKYLMTETIQKVKNNYNDGTSVIDFYFKVKAVYKNSVEIDNYHCDFPSGVGFFEVNGRRIDRRDSEHSVIERKIIDYLTKNF